MTEMEMLETRYTSGTGGNEHQHYAIQEFCLPRQPCFFWRSPSAAINTTSRQLQTQGGHLPAWQGNADVRMLFGQRAALRVTDMRSRVNLSSEIPPPSSCPCECASYTPFFVSVISHWLNIELTEFLSNSKCKYCQYYAHVN